MLHVDLTEFAKTGALGTIERDATRSQITKLLGMPDQADSYPGVITYGHMSFDLAGGDGPGCTIQISFPHTTHDTGKSPRDSAWTNRLLFNQWPDHRLSWELGSYCEGATIDELAPETKGFVETELITSTNDLRIFHNPNSRVDLIFETDLRCNARTLSCMVAHGGNIAG